MKRIIVLLALATVSLQVIAAIDPVPEVPEEADSTQPASATPAATNKVSEVSGEALSESDVLSGPKEVEDADSKPEEVAKEEPEQTASTLGSETHIYSDSAEFGLKSRTATYSGNVRVKDPRMDLTCEQLTARVPMDGTRIEQVVAKTNVVIVASDEEGRTYTAKGDMAVYTYEVADGATNEVVELSGSPIITSPDGTLAGDVIIWDRISNTMKAVNQRTIFVLPEETEANLLKEVEPKDPYPDASSSDADSETEEEQPE